MAVNQSSISPDCYPCIFQQVTVLSSLMNLEGEQKRSLFEELMTDLLATGGKGIVVQHIARKATDSLLSMLDKPHDFDPYLIHKKKSNDIAVSYLPLFKQQIKDSDDPLGMAIKLAAAGNIIDFGAKNYRELDIEAELESIDERGFGIYDSEPFVASLKNAKTLLYLCDNAGEIVLDKLFIEELKKAYPGLNITCAVRHKPIINDALLADAHYVGLNHVVPVISSGSVYPGTIVAETSNDFQRLFKDADMIISKGQGNFETLLCKTDPRIFFILRIKCQMMAQLANTAQGNLVLMQNC